MSVNINPVHPVAATNLADSSGSEQPRNPEAEEMKRHFQAMNDAMNDAFERSKQELDRNIQMLDRNKQRLDRNDQRLDRNDQRLDRNDQTLDNLKENLEQIEEGIQELQNYQQTAVNKIFVFVVQGFQRVQEMGSSMIRIPGYPNAPMLQGTSQPVESQRDPDSASSPLPPAQPAEKKSLRSTFSLGSMLQFGRFLSGYGRSLHKHLI